MIKNNQTGNISGNSGTTLIGNHFWGAGGGVPAWLLLLIAFCTLVLTGAGVWVAAVVALR